MAKPIVKWAGGKSKLLGELLARVPAHVRTYAEPFAGGAALFFALASDATRSFDHAILAVEQAVVPHENDHGIVQLAAALEFSEEHADAVID